MMLLGELEATIDPDGRRNRSMGRELDRISRGLCTKIPIHVTEGKRRPEAPMQAAKLASEGGIILRQHVPILPHRKEYKKDEALVKNYIGKVVVSETQFYSFHQLSFYLLHSQILMFMLFTRPNSPWTPIVMQTKLHVLICSRVGSDR